MSRSQRLVLAFLPLALLFEARSVSALNMPSQFCTGDPCIITGTKTADSGITLDFGSRAVIVQGDLKLGTLASGNRGSLIILAGSFTVDTTGQIEGAGGTHLGGSLSIQTTGNIAFNSTRSTGAVRIPGADGGNLILVTTAGNITGSGFLNLDHDGTEASGGTLTINTAGSVTYSGRILLEGGTQGFGGIVDITAAGDINLTGGVIDMNAGEGGGGEITIVGDGNLTFGDVNMDGGSDSGDAGFSDVNVGGNLTVTGRWRGRGAANGERCGDGADVDFTAGGDIVFNGEFDIRGLALDCTGGSLAVDGSNVYFNNFTRMGGDGSEGGGGDIDADALHLLSISGTVNLDGGLGGGGEVAFFSDENIQISGTVDVRGRTPDSDGALLIDVDSGGALTISGSLLGAGGVNAAGGDTLLYACDLTTTPTAVIGAQGLNGSIDVTATDTLSLRGQFLVDPATGVIAITYGTHANPPTIAATFSVPPTTTLDPTLIPCRFCNSNAECVDGNLCTDDVCVPATGCTNPPNTLPCNDGNQCTVGDACSGGACVPGGPRNCVDGNPCTSDACIPASGCSNPPISGPCSDGNACTENDTCSAGVCNGTPKDCSDGNPCTSDTCSAGNCSNPPNSLPCNDGDTCTTNDQCSGGSCAGGPPLDCNDNDVCTNDSCNPGSGPGSGCAHDPVGGGCTDTDGDGKPDSEDECTLLDWTATPLEPPNQDPLKFRMNLKGLSLPIGGQSILLKGFFNPAPPAQPIDLVQNGLHVFIEDSVGVVYDVNIPGGLVGTSPCGAQDGWKVVGAVGKMTWKYRNKSGALPPACVPGSAKGISSAFVKDQRSSSKDALLMKVKAKGAVLASNPVLPPTRLQATVSLAAQSPPGTASPQAIAGQCAEALFTGNPVPSTGPKPVCKLKARGGFLDGVSCKGP
jgi:hypothetical protein